MTGNSAMKYRTFFPWFKDEGEVVAPGARF